MRRLLLLLVFACNAAFGQQTAIPWSGTIISDTKWPEPEKSHLPFFFSAGIESRIISEKAGKTRYDFSDGEAVWYKDLSYMADSLRDRYIPLAQLYFDCYEFELRRIRGQLNQGDDQVRILALAQERAENLAEEIGEFTDSGADKPKLQEMRLWMDSLLLSTPSDRIPEIKLRDFGIDLYAGLSQTAYFNSGANYFPPKTGIAFGAGIFYKRLYVSYFQTGGRMNATADFEAEDFKFLKGDRLLNNQISIALGCRIFNRDHFKLIPFVSIGSFRITNLTQPKESLYGKGPRSFGPGAGFRSQWNFNPFVVNASGAHIFHVFIQSEFQWIDYLYKVPVQTLRITGGIGYTFQNAGKTAKETTLPESQERQKDF